MNNFRQKFASGEKFSEEGKLKHVNEMDVIVTRGSYTIIEKDGSETIVNYTADENGFHPEVGKFRRFDADPLREYFIWLLQIWIVLYIKLTFWFFLTIFIFSYIRSKRQIDLRLRFLLTEKNWNKNIK